MAANGLCADCQSLPLDTLFTRLQTYGRLSQLYTCLGTLKEVWTRSDCAFCSMIKYTLSQHYGDSIVESKIQAQESCLLMMSPCPVDMTIDLAMGTKEKLQKPMALYQQLVAYNPRGTSLTPTEYDDYLYAPMVQLILSDKTTNTPYALFGKRVVPDSIDWDHVNRWLTVCQQRHSTRADSSDEIGIWNRGQASGVSQLLVVDVLDDCVTPLPNNEQYLALSYMWGGDQKLKLQKANRALMETPGFLSTPGGQPSRTIRHAIEVTRKLGRRYLWADALCIVQDDDQIFLDNVSKMDVIYSEAWLTIVAAAGKDADGGIPGVTAEVVRTRCQMCVTVVPGPRREPSSLPPTEPPDSPPITVANVLDNGGDVINGSTWNTRGWTYQERLLSRRQLIFTTAQVFFHCRDGCRCREDRHLGDAQGTEASSSDSFFLDFENSDLFAIFAQAVHEYTERFLSEPEDKIWGLFGILTRLARLFGAPFFFGLPSSLFDAGLLWMPVGTCTRGDKRFPSWSWAGWDGPVRYSLALATNFCECTASQADIDACGDAVRLCSKVDCPSRERQRVFSGDQTRSWTRLFDEDDASIYYYLESKAAQDRLGFQYRIPRPVPAMEKNTAGILSTNESTTLRIEAKVADFLLSDDLNTELVPGRHTTYKLDILDTELNIAGAVFVDQQNVPLLAGKTHSFLALSRATLWKIQEDPAWDEDEKCFRSWTHHDSGVKDAHRTLQEGDRWSYFDWKAFNDSIYWPVYNVLLLSKPNGSGAVERLGIGKIHVDAFLAAPAKDKCVYLS